MSLNSRARAAMLRDGLGVEAMQGADQGGQVIGGEVEVALEPGGEGSGGDLEGGGELARGDGVGGEDGLESGACFCHGGRGKEFGLAFVKDSRVEEKEGWPLKSTD